MDDATYASLRALNPSGRVSQWCYEEGETKEPPAFFDTLTGKHEDYRHDSLIARIDFAEGVVVYMTLSKDGRQLYEGEGWHDYHSSELHLVECQLWEVKTIQCHGDRCRRDFSFSYADNGIWCVSCHGDPDLYAVFHDLMPPSVAFQEIPREAILWARTDGVFQLAECTRNRELERLRQQLQKGGFFDQQAAALQEERKKAQARFDELSLVPRH